MIVDRRRADEDTRVETKGENCTTAKEMGGKGKEVRKQTGWEEMVFVPHHAKHAMIGRKSGGLVSDPGEVGGDLMLGGCHPDFRSPVTEELSDGPYSTRPTVVWTRDDGPLPEISLSSDDRRGLIL